MFPIDKFSSVNIELVSDSRSPKARLSRWKSEGNKSPYYSLTLTSPPLDYREGRAVAAKLDSYHGNLTNFNLNNPIPPIKAHTGLFLYQAASKNSNQVVIGGFSPNQIDAVAAGDFIQIGSDTKVYGIAEDSDANSSSRCTVKLSQSLIDDHASTEPVAYGKDVVFQVCMEDRDSADITVKDNKFIVHDVELIEQQ